MVRWLGMKLVGQASLGRDAGAGISDASGRRNITAPKARAQIPRLNVQFSQRKARRLLPEGAGGR